MDKIKEEIRKAVKYEMEAHFLLYDTKFKINYDGINHTFDKNVGIIKYYYQVSYQKILFLISIDLNENDVKLVFTEDTPIGIEINEIVNFYNYFCKLNLARLKEINSYYIQYYT